MGYANENGYTPTTIETMMSSVRENINTEFGTSYTAETFMGTNFYKYFYSLMQRSQENEIKTSEIFAKLQQYFRVTNERISRPVVTNPGLIEALETNGYIASVKKPIDADAGKVFVCVDVDDGGHASGIVTITSYANLISGTDDTITVGATVFTAQAGAATPGDATFQADGSNSLTAESLADQINAHATAGVLVKATAVGAVVTIRAIHGGEAGNSIALEYDDNDTNVGATVSVATLEGGTEPEEDYEAIRLDICTIIKDSTVAGTVSQGTEEKAIVLSNGQSFDFKYNLPNRIPVLLRLTITVSENNQVVILTPEETKDILIANIAAEYRLGRNFEPQRYFSVDDAPWASDVLLEWSINDGGSYFSTVYDAEYDDLFEFDIGDVELVEV